MKLYLLRPDLDRIDCKVCRTYEHYGWSNADPEKRGRTITDPSGAPIPRAARSEPNCQSCPVSVRWTPQNRALYRRYKIHLLGINTGEIDERTAWAFYHLAEAEREIEQERRDSTVCPMLAGY